MKIFMQFKKSFSVFLGTVLLLNSNITFAYQSNNHEKNFEPKSNIETVKKAAIAAGTTLLALAGIRYAANSFIFSGSYLCSGKQDIDGERITSHYINLGDLSGRELKLKNPQSHDLDGRCVLIFSPNAGCSADMVMDAPYPVSGYSLFKLLDRGATLVGIDYRGYGGSKQISKLRISERTVYADGEKMYDYVRNTLHYQPKDIILYAHSLGGAVSSHVLSYASRKGEDLCGLILASPINNLYSAASAFTCKPLGAFARVVSMSELNTEKNLSTVRNKNTPIFLCSGDYADVLSLEKTRLHEKIRNMGFANVTVSIHENCGHCDLDIMFKPRGVGRSMPVDPERQIRDTYADYIAQLARQ